MPPRATRAFRLQPIEDLGQRPSSQAQLDYAALDVEILLAVHEKLAAEDPQTQLPREV